MSGVSSVVEVVESGNCVCCGGCLAVCVSNAISLDYDGESGFFRISLDRSRCTSCAQCTQVCPAIHFRESASESKTGVDVALGESLELFLAYSCDSEVRNDSSSGGVANALLRYLLDEKIAQTIVLVKARHQQPFAEIVEIVDSGSLKGEPREYASRYVSMPLLAGLKQVRSSRIGIVCVPCQASAARKVCQMLKIDAVIVGIACAGGFSARATLQVLREKGIVRPRRVYYRGGGWPGKFLAEGWNAHGQENRLEEDFYAARFNEILRSFVYRNPACWNCRDHFGEEADVSLFDFWNEEFACNERVGQTGVIIRNKRMSSIFHTMAEEHRVTVGSKLLPSEVIRSQGHHVKLKKERFAHDSKRNIWAIVLEAVIRLHSIMGLSRSQHSRMSIHGWMWVFRLLIHMSNYGKNQGVGDRGTKVRQT